MTAAVNLIQIANAVSRFEVIDMFDCEGLVFSMFDGSGYAALPWAKAGYKVICFNADEGDHGSYQSVRVTHPNIRYVNAWIDDDFKASACNLLWGRPDFVMAFPPCTDLANSGSRHWKRKAEIDPDFQVKAAATCKIAAEIADHFGTPYMIENPVGKLSTLWRKPDHKFHPCDYGGYIHIKDEAHPAFPDIIPASDAYNKQTCLWTGNGFVMPEALPVDPIGNDNPGWKKLGGKSARTKLIRSLTPRGLAIAVWLANSK